MAKYAESTVWEGCEIEGLERSVLALCLVKDLRSTSHCSIHSLEELFLELAGFHMPM